MDDSAKQVKRRGSTQPRSTPPRFAGEMLGVLSDIMSVQHLDTVLQKIAYTVADLFSIKALIICVIDENEQVFRVRAAYGYDGKRTEQIKKLTYSIERMNKDLDEKYRIADNVYFVRPGPEDFVKADEPLYFDVREITRPRATPDDWHELDYLKLVFTGRDGAAKGFIEVEEPSTRKVMDSETIDAMRIFAELVGVAIENAKLFQKQTEIVQRTQFLADIIAHDINNYNQAITSYLQMALDPDIEGPRMKTYLERASSAAWGISDLIQRADRLTRIEEEGGKNIGPIDLVEVLKESTNEVTREHTDKSVKVNLNTGTHRYFATGNELANEIFTNILANAVQYDPHEEIVIDVSIGEFFVDYRRYWCISIADNGIGIPDSKKNVVFGRFNKSSEGPPALGLGLSIVRSIVEAYHGMVWVEDRVPGEHWKGSIFRVSLPMASAK
jgi:signal transduction histidine kinase